MPIALLVDDDVQLLRSVAAIAELAGLELVTAATWDEGLALFQVLSPDLVVADYNMPGSRHGLRLLVQIRRLRPSVRVILISGYLDRTDMERVLELDLVDRALTKGSATQTARAIVEEIQDAAAAAVQRTDWVVYAAAYLRASGASPAALDELEAMLGAKLDAGD